jgi:tetratricopeptide (TPR) repeat protein
VLQTHHNKSLAATIELSLASPTFHSLGPDARDLLGVVAFFPQGINEKNLDWLFPTTSNRKKILDEFCVLSLTYRSKGFVTLLAPIRDHLSPQDPRSSPLLCATRDRYFTRLSVNVDPDLPGFEETRWITLEDVNVEHLLDVFTSIDQMAGVIWDTCHHFLEHLYWHKPRQTVLRPRIEGLPDNHRFKPNCLLELSRLFERAGNHGERKRLLIRTLELERQRGDDNRVAQVLYRLADVNRLLGLHEEGIQQAREALEIFERAGNTIEQADCLGKLTWLLYEDKQLDAAEGAASRAIDLISSKGEEFLVTGLHRILGKIHHSKGRREKAIHHFNVALEIASPRHWNDQLFWTHYGMAEMFRDEHEYDEAHAHIEQAKLYAVDDVYKLGRAIELQAKVWYNQGRFEEATSAALHALENYEKVGAARDAEFCRDLLQKVEQAMHN